MTKLFKGILVVLSISILTAALSFAERQTTSGMNASEIHGVAKSEERPSYEEVGALKGMIDKAIRLLRQHERRQAMFRMLSFNARYIALNNLMTKNDRAGALRIYDPLYAEVKQIIDRYEPAPAPAPVVQAPSRHEIRELFAKIGRARAIAREKNTMEFASKIDRAEDLAGKIRRDIRRNDNQAARQNYEQALSLIEATIDQLNRFQPPRRRIQAAANASDQPQEVYSASISYFKKLSGNRIHARERADYRYEVNFPAPPVRVKLKIWGKLSSMGRNYVMRIRLNGHKVIEAAPSFTTTTSVWTIDVPANYVKNGNNVVRIVLIKPFKHHRFVDLSGMLLEVIYHR